MKNKEKKTPVTPEEAMVILEKAAQEKANACWNEIQEVLKKHGYGLGIEYKFILNPVNQ